MTAGSPDPLAASWAELLREKRSLAAIVRDAGRLCIQDSVDIVLDVCDELANAHANGIVHGDLGLHRVRTMWPRRPGDFVDIWALDADDTGAIDFRAAFQAPALAPEQRTGKIGDVRSDIWAVGAILHALIGGAPPQAGGRKRPVREMLPGAPKALVSLVEQCLADDPDARPRSVDDVAGALASFASDSPERFQALARRRMASLKAKHVPTKLSALARLDDNAMQRASSVSMPAAQPMPAAAPVIPPAPATQPTVGALRPPTRPSYSDAELPPTQVRPSSRPSFFDVPQPMTQPPMTTSPSTLPQAYGQGPMTTSPSTLPQTNVHANATAQLGQLGEPVRTPSGEEWPQMHGVPSTSIQVAPADAPTRAQPRNGTLPMAEPLPEQELPETISRISDQQLPVAKVDRWAAAAARSRVNTAPMIAPSMYPPSAAFPSAVPTVAAAPAPSMTPPPVEVRPSASDFPGFGVDEVRSRSEMPVAAPVGFVAPVAVASEPQVAANIPPAPQAYRQRSYHPPSFGPMSIDTGADELHFPQAGRVPSFSDLAEYREAKRASRRSAITAVIMAAAVLIIGFGYGARVLKEDRANMRAAEAAAAHAPPPPPAPVAITPAAAPAPAATPAPSASASAKPEAAKPETTKKAAPKAAAHKSAPAHKAAASKTEKSDAMPKEPEFAPNTVFGDAIGKKDAAPANALSDGLK